MDAVGSRDFALQALSAASIAGVTLSRLAEEIVLWTSPHFGFARLADDWSTGSSIMPQKRNPDAAELIRAKTKRISANLAALTAIMAGLPLTYAKDMQDDKALTFEAFDALDLCLGAMTGMMATIQFDRVVLAGAADRGFSTATDLADWLVRTLNMPFREAHHVTGAVVKSAEARGLTSLRTLPLAELQAIEPRITEDARRLLDVAASVDSRSSVGGTAPAQVRAQIARWRAVFAASSEQESEA
jgi:argininosuccinate lyase